MAKNGEYHTKVHKLRISGKEDGWLHPIVKGEYPFDTYHIDYLGPLPSTKKEYRYLFIVIAVFTKFVYIYTICHI